MGLPSLYHSRAAAERVVFSTGSDQRCHEDHKWLRSFPGRSAAILVRSLSSPMALTVSRRIVAARSRKNSVRWHVVTTCHAS